MRTLSDPLTAEQKKASRTPYVRVYLSAASSTPGSAATYTVVTSGVALHAWANAGRSIARKSDGTLCVVFTDMPATKYRTYIIYSTDGGETWSGQEQVSLTNEDYNHRRPSITIDSSDNIHVTWEGQGYGTYPNKYSIFYRKKTTVWLDQEVLSADEDYTDRESSIAIDSSDNVHALWEHDMDEAGDKLLYRQNTGSWGSIEQVSTNGHFVGTDYLAIDYSDVVHVAWQDAASSEADSKANYNYRASGAWQGEEAMSDLSGSQYFPVIAIDEANNVHASFAMETGDDRVIYVKRTNTWQDEEGVFTPSASEAIGICDISLDSYSNVHVLFGYVDAETNLEAKYRRRTYYWLDQEDIDINHDSHSPRLLWATWPLISSKRTNRPKAGYAGLYHFTEGATVYLKYVASPDLTWE